MHFFPGLPHCNVQEGLGRHKVEEVTDRAYDGELGWFKPFGDMNKDEQKPHVAGRVQRRAVRGVRKGR